MNWAEGVFILQCVTLITVAGVGVCIVQNLNSIEGILNTIADLIAYDYEDVKPEEKDF